MTIKPIHDETAYAAALRRVEEVMEAGFGTWDYFVAMLTAQFSGHGARHGSPGVKLHIQMDYDTGMVEYGDVTATNISPDNSGCGGRDDAWGFRVMCEDNFVRCCNVKRSGHKPQAQGFARGYLYPVF